MLKNVLGEANRVQKKLAQVRAHIKDMPKDQLVCELNKGYVKWYKKKGTTKQYIKKSNFEEAATLAEAKYYRALENDLLREMDILNQFIEFCNEVPQSETLRNDERYKKLLLNIGKNREIASASSTINYKIKAWLAEETRTNPNHQDNLKFASSNGLFVRSKAESMIVTSLNRAGIPFKYEAELKLGSITYYPDFTIMHPKTGEFIYWEHLGLMDNPEYIGKTFKKLVAYAEAGIVPNINLIITSETNDKPLDQLQIDGVIDNWFEKCYF